MNTFLLVLCIGRQGKSSLLRDGLERKTEAERMRKVEMGIYVTCLLPRFLDPVDELALISLPRGWFGSRSSLPGPPVASQPCLGPRILILAQDRPWRTWLDPYG